MNVIGIPLGMKCEKDWISCRARYWNHMIGVKNIEL